jgi:hypothetical protein
MDGYNQPPKQEQPQSQQQVATQGEEYPSDYYYPQDTFRGMMPNDQAAQVRQAVYPDDIYITEDADFEQYIPMLMTLIDRVARIPGIDHNQVTHLNRKMIDIIDRAHSEGRRKVTASKMQKMYFKLRSLVPQGDIAMPGMTGIGAIVTTNTNVKQELKTPQQPQTQGFWPWSRK